MIILHCMKESEWEKVKDKHQFGEKDIEREGFIHCSSIEYMWRLSWLFKDIQEELVLLCLDTDKVESEIKWEDGSGCGRMYPHVYGVINTDAVIKALPYKKDMSGEWIKNSEFKNIDNK